MFTVYELLFVSIVSSLVDFNVYGLMLMVKVFGLSFNVYCYLFIFCLFIFDGLMFRVCINMLMAFGLGLYAYGLLCIIYNLICMFIDLCFIVMCLVFINRCLLLIILHVYFNIYVVDFMYIAQCL